MAVQAPYLAHGFPYDSRRHQGRTELDASPVLGGRLPTATTTTQQAVGGNVAACRDLTCDNDDGGCFVPRKRARGVSDVVMEEGHGSLLPPLPVQLRAFAPAGDVRQGCRVLCSGAAASTSGRPAPASSRGLLSLLYRHSVETDALVRTENERLRAGLEAARRRHAKAVVSVLSRAAARRLRVAEAELQRALVRNAELEERLRQACAEGRAWQGVAQRHEAVAAGLRATLDQLLLRSPRDGAGTSVLGTGHAEDAQSCCFEQGEEGADDARVRARACKSCGDVDACVLLLPCRHLCLCARCEADADACPVCLATKNASLHVLLS